MVITWDNNKNAVNKKKHGIGFEYAKLAFADPNRIELYDEEHSIYEDRYRIIGMVEEVLVVVYTMRKSAYRIISARKATRMEREYYEQICNR